MKCRAPRAPEMPRVDKLRRLSIRELSQHQEAWNEESSWKRQAYLLCGLENLMWLSGDVGHPPDPSWKIERYPFLVSKIHIHVKLAN